MWIEDPPARCYRLVENERGRLQPDTSNAVWVFPFRPGLLGPCTSWATGSSVATANGGPVLVLADGGGVCGLGDFVVRGGDGRFVAESADGFDQRYAIAGDE